MKINKQFFTSLLAFTVLGVLAVSLSLFFPSSRSEAPTEVTLSDRAQNAFASVEIINAGGAYSVTAEDGVYSCDRLAGLPLSQSACDELARECTSLTAVGPLVQDPDAPVDYGFDFPLAQAQATYSDGGGISIEVGAQITGTDQYYIRVNGGNTVYQIGRSSIRYLLSDISSYLDLSLSPVEEAGNALPSSIEWTTNGQTLRLDRLPIPQTDGMELSYSYQLAGDRLSYVDPDAFTTYFDQLSTLRADGVVTLYPSEPELKEYGLSDESDYSTLSFTLLGQSVTLRIGNFTGNFYYLYREGVPAVYRLNLSEAHWIGVTRYALMSRYLMAPALDTLREIQIEASGQTYLFDLTETSVSFNGEFLSQETFEQFYRLLCSLRAEYEMEDPMQNIPPDAVITFVYDEPLAGTELPDSGYRTEVIRFIPYGVKRHAIEIDGTAQYAVRSSYLSRLLFVLSDLQDGQEIDPTW